MSKRNNIFLVGLMGAGKTTVGKKLARQLGWSFVDTDQEIVARTGASVATIFEIEGEAGFRRREAEVIAELVERTSIVLGTGGGVVLDPSNRARLAAHGWVVYINVAPYKLAERLRHDRLRPLLQVADPLKRLNTLYEQRNPLYREIADTIVNGNVMNAKVIAQELKQEIETECVP